MRLVLVALVLLLAGCEQPVDAPQSDVQVVAFTATWCKPCHRNEPVLQRIESSGVQVTRVDIDAEQSKADSFGIRSVPTYLVYQGETLVLRTGDVDAVWRLVNQ